MILELTLIIFDNWNLYINIINLKIIHQMNSKKNKIK
jgi:hypothetical protein